MRSIVNSFAACGVASLFALVFLFALGCEPSVSQFGPGLHLNVRVGDAQLRAGDIGEDNGGPEVSQVLRPQAEVFRGEAGVNLRGRLAPGGVALHLQADGDPDHWVLPAAGVDFVVDDELQFAALLDFSYSAAGDRLPLRLRASDANGSLGPLTETEFFFTDQVPSARMEVSLGWDAPVDLDLHLELPDGTVVGSKNINSYEPPPGQIPPADGGSDGGFLDFDSNQQCELDLRNRESIVWLNADPPPGVYRVYAHLFAPCGQGAVNMIAVTMLGDELIARGGATQYEFDSRTHPSSGEPPGLLMFEFEVP